MPIPEKPRTVAIVPAAGFGRRLGYKTKKPFVLLGRMPIIAHTLQALDRCKAIDEIVIASEPSCARRFKGLVKRYRFTKVSGIIAGGRTRFESVKNCLEAIGRSFDIVVVHDGARPFIDANALRESVKLARKYGACIIAAKETDTVKLTDDNLFIRKTIDRESIFRAQTPQVFRYDVIRRAYEAKGGSWVTDDASLVERLGKPVKILIGNYFNIKITTREDLRIAEAWLRNAVP